LHYQQAPGFADPNALITSNIYQQSVVDAIIPAADNNIRMTIEQGMAADWQNHGGPPAVATPGHQLAGQAAAASGFSAQLCLHLQSQANR